MEVINSGLLAIQGRNGGDQLWFTGDTGEEWRWSPLVYWRYRGEMKVINSGLLAIQGGMKVISCGLLVIYSHLFKVEYERYQRDFKVCTFCLSFKLMFFIRKRQGIYFYIYNEPITDEFTNSWTSKIKHMRSDVVQLVNTSIFNFLECEWTVHNEWKVSCYEPRAECR